MEYRQLGRTGLKVSALCLGSMTWGNRNTEAEGHAQLDRSVEAGINFIDTAEMYAVPPRAETYGATERIIGNWLEMRKNRDKLIIASKIAGPGAHLAYVRDGNSRLKRPYVAQAVDASLKRLKTDYIDLYQTHWPDRRANFFGPLGYKHDPDEDKTDLAETLDALDEQVKAGKIRHIGLSNETAWGTMRCVALAEAKGLPRVASVQNPYSLLNRTYEVGLAEVSIREEVGLLAYSPLGGGAISGKYLGGRIPPRSRWSMDSRPSRYNSPAGHAAVASYVQLARDHGLDTCQMALAYALKQPFCTSVIFGATSMEHLENNLKSAGLVLSEEVLAGIETIHTQFPNPCP